MREIKFRVWDNLENRWYDPTFEGYRGKIEEIMLSPRGRLTMRTMTKFLDESMFPNRFELMQYTGLHDKNGREVYEGDLVNVHRVVLSPDDRIGWVEYTAQYGYSIRFGDRRCRQSDWATDEGAKYEVIGNIFENPELLELEK